MARKKLVNVMKTLDRLGVPYTTRETPFRFFVCFTGVHGQPCEVGNGDYGNSWSGFEAEDKTSKSICKGIEEHFKQRIK